MSQEIKRQPKTARVLPYELEPPEKLAPVRPLLLADYSRMGTVVVKLADHPVQIEKPSVEALVADYTCEV